MIDKRFQQSSRIAASFLLLAVILWMSIYLIANRDRLFMRKVILTYADGCTETYINENLTTSECTIGRLLEERNKLLQKPIWSRINLSELNITGS